MDRHRLVVVENDNLKEPAGPVGTYVEVTVALPTTRMALRTACSMPSSATPCLRASSAISTYASYPAATAAQVTLRSPGNYVRTATHVRQDLITPGSLPRDERRAAHC